MQEIVPLVLLVGNYSDDNQRYGLQDNFMIKYPKLIKTATEKLANVREDVKARDKELIDNPEFAITIGKANNLKDSEDEELHLLMVDDHIPAGAKLY